jgi:hypothetical protein
VGADTVVSLIRIECGWDGESGMGMGSVTLVDCQEDANVKNECDV